MALLSAAGSAGGEGKGRCERVGTLGVGCRECGRDGGGLGRGDCEGLVGLRGRMEKDGRKAWAGESEGEVVGRG